MQDMQEWTACQFFNTTPAKLSDDEREMTDQFCLAIQQKLPTKKFPTRKANQKPMKKILLTLDQPKIYHRPLALYLSVRCIDAFCRMALHFLGFKHGNDKQLPYHIRKGTSSEPSIVFFHGLGVGLTSYILFAAGLAFNYPDRTIVLFEMPSITMKLNDNHVLPEEFSSHVADTLLSLGLTKNIISGHSLGTACVAWMLRFHPHLVHASIFVDPVCFRLWYHHIAYNALYRTPKGFHETFINLVAMTEPDHAVFLHRYFVWWHNAILTCDLPENCYIFLSEKDNIVATGEVVDYLLENPSPTRRIVLYKAFRHGQILASPEFTRVIRAFKDVLV